MAIPPNNNPVVRHLTAAVEQLDDDLQDERAAHAHTRGVLHGVTQQLAHQQHINGLAVQVIHQTRVQNRALQDQLDQLNRTCPVRTMNALSQLKNRVSNFLHANRAPIAAVFIAALYGYGLALKHLESNGTK